jgi:hypothetical protein
MGLKDAVQLLAAVGMLGGQAAKLGHQGGVVGLPRAADLGKLVQQVAVIDAVGRRAA